MRRLVSETLSRSHLRHLRLMNAYDMNYKNFTPTLGMNDDCKVDDWEV